MKEVEEDILAGLKEKFRLFLQNECHELLAESFKELAKQYIAEEWGKVLDIPLTIDQVASLLDQDPQTIYKWRQRGTLPFYKRGGRVFCNFRDLYKIILDNKRALNL